jgi:hypothetical protein
MKSISSQRFKKILEKFGLKHSENTNKKHNLYKIGDKEFYIGDHHKEQSSWRFKEHFEKLGIKKSEINRFFEDKKFQKQKIEEFKKKNNIK